jgi:hypothetical protein
MVGMTANQLAKGTGTDPEWQQIVEQIVEQLGDQLPDNVVEATECLLAGWPVYKISKKISVPTKTIRGWLELYPAMALAVAKGRKLLTMWRMSKLEQQFVQAVEKSEEVLDLDLSDREVNAKLVGTVAQHARFIIGLFVGQKMDINVTVEEGGETLKAKKDALSYLAAQMMDQRNSGEPIEGVYRVVNAAVPSVPLLNEKGEPAFGALGVLDTDDQRRALCHICGTYTSAMTLHINTTHHMKIREYEIMYMLPAGAIVKHDLEYGETANGQPVSS